ncbi:MAG: nitroreductase family deazaflavin-dependent oxidoreductase [Anaerolineales bacterium]
MKFPNPPRGIKALPWKLPILVYRLGLGWLLGKRFLLLEHTGRKTGKLRRAVLEVISSTPEENVYYVVSGFGTGSNWYRNILQQPQVTIQLGRHRYQATAKQLPPQQASELMVRYEKEHPASLKALSSLLGYEFEQTTEGIREFGRQIPVIQFTARTPDHERKPDKQDY